MAPEPASRLTLRVTPWAKLIIGCIFFLGAAVMLLNVGILGLESLAEPERHNHGRDIPQFLGLGALLLVLAVLWILSARPSWAKITIQDGLITYKRRLERKTYSWPVTAAKALVVERWKASYKAYGSVWDGYLIIDHEGGRHRISLGDPMFLGGGVLRRVRRLHEALHLPVEDPLGLRLTHSRVFIRRWMARGQEWKIFAFIFGGAALLATVMSFLD